MMLIQVDATSVMTFLFSLFVLSANQFRTHAHNPVSQTLPYSIYARLRVLTVYGIYGSL